jgi:hypothetical protein
MVGHAIAQAVSSRLLTAETRVRTQVRPRAICERSGIGTGFSPSPPVFHCQYHSTAVPYSLMYHLVDTYQLVDGQRARQRPSSTGTVSPHRNNNKTEMHATVEVTQNNWQPINMYVGESGHAPFYGTTSLPAKRSALIGTVTKQLTNTR